MSVKHRRERLMRDFSYIADATDRRLYLSYSYHPGDGKARYIVHSQDLGTITLVGLREAEIWAEATTQAIWHLMQLG